MKEYLFSVIMSVYNVENYIHEAVDSILSQDIGLQNIQIIFVDDGSTDNSGKICDEYQAKYPDNIVVIHKENGGLSSARNVGVKVATGRYLNFFDPDDILQKNALSAVWRFWEAHETETDVVAIPIFQFGLVNGPHPLNSKFEKGSRVIDLTVEWQNAQLSLATSFIKTDFAKASAFTEDLHMPTGEDARELIKLLTRKYTLGVVHDTKYLYRKRENSNLFGITQKRNYYTEYLYELPEWAFQYCKENFGSIPKFVMYTVMYDLQWSIRLDNIPDGLLTQEETQRYQETIAMLLRETDDDVIMAQKNIYTEQKSLILAQKYGTEPQRVRYGNDYLYGYKDAMYFSLAGSAFHLSIYEMKNGYAHIDAWTPSFVNFDNIPLEVYAMANGVAYPAEIRTGSTARCSLGTPVYTKKFLHFAIPLPETGSVTVSFYRRLDGFSFRYTNIKTDKYFPVVTSYENSYYYAGNYLLQYRKGNLLLSRKGSLSLRYEWNFCKELWKKNQLGGRKAVFTRPLILLLRKWIKKPIWLFADKSDRADDNAEAFFEYCCRQKQGEHRYIFLLSKDSPDYERLKKIGTVVPYMSKLHRFVYLLADHIISAYSHDELNNPFLGHEESYHDLLQKCKFIFLQHGIIKDDLSEGLNKYHKNMKMFVCSVPQEWASVVETPDYGYTREEVVLTGLPRYDRLYNDPKNEIVIMPTWRRKLMGTYHKETSRWDLLPGFEQSPYCHFYNALLASPRLKVALQKYGYRLNFMPHPIMFPYIDRFEIPNHVNLLSYNASYRDVFAHNKLLLTDYSSTVFDFAYLRKPVVYAHFDQNHYAEGYFDYERDGFGEVEYDLEGTVDRIIEYMENGCQLKDKYRQRIDSFFAFNDKNNCERVYQKILALDKD